MTKFDLGVWSGIVFATIPGIKVYQEYGILAGIGAYVASILILGLLLLGGFFVLMLIMDKRKDQDERDR